MDFSDNTGMPNNILQSLFGQCNVTLNGLNITQASEHYHYRSYLEALMTYGSDAAATRLWNTYWYLDTVNMQPVDLSAENVTAMTKKVFILRWNRINASKEIHLFVRLHSDICNVPLYLRPGVWFQMRLTKARPCSYLMKKSVESKIVFKFLDTKLLVRRVRLNPAILLAHTATLKNRGVSRAIT